MTEDTVLLTCKDNSATIVKVIVPLVIADCFRIIDMQSID